jgi:hypothetical protein
MAEPTIDPEKECFFIAPIGADGSDIRRRSDGVRDYIVKPAMAEFGLEVLRADDLKKPGQITLQVIEHVYRAKACVVDLTGRNANVYYEMAVRHTARLPVVLIIEEDELDDLPFDIQQMRVIPFSHTDLASAAKAKNEIVAHMREALDGEVDSPIGTVLNLQTLQQGTSVERTLADLVTRVEALTSTTGALARKVQGDAEVRASSQVPEILGGLLSDRDIDSDILLRRGGKEYVVVAKRNGGTISTTVPQSAGWEQLVRTAYVVDEELQRWPNVERPTYIDD